MKHLLNTPLCPELQAMGNSKTMHERLLDSFIVPARRGDPFFEFVG